MVIIIETPPKPKAHKPNFQMNSIPYVWSSPYDWIMILY